MSDGLLREWLIPNHVGQVQPGSTRRPSDRMSTTYYSKYTPDLPRFEQSGYVLSGLAIDENDPLARRDEGLEVLDVASELNAHSTPTLQGDRGIDTWTITNTSLSIVDSICS